MGNKWGWGENVVRVAGSRRKGAKGKGGVVMGGGRVVEEKKSVGEW